LHTIYPYMVFGQLSFLRLLKKNGMKNLKIPNRICIDLDRDF